MTTSNISINYHTAIKQFALACGYPEESCSKGLCSGIQWMASQAVCVDDVSLFNNRIKKIHDLVVNKATLFQKIETFFSKLSHFFRELFSKFLVLISSFFIKKI
jgi:deoxyhypusine synthase